MNMDIVVYHKNEESNGLLPQPLRCLIVGPSGSGKTNLLLNFIYNRVGLLYKNIYVFSRSIEQSAYVDLQRHYENVEREVGKRVAYFFSNCDDLIQLDDCEPHSLVIFDDCLLEKQTKIKDYFIRGRHKDISCIYLSQSYGKVDMQVIRNNVNLLCIFNLNRYYTKKVYDDFVGSDMTIKQFEALCKKCWDSPHGFISINNTKKVQNGKYKFNLKKDFSTSDICKRPTT